MVGNDDGTSDATTLGLEDGSYEMEGDVEGLGINELLGCIVGVNVGTQVTDDSAPNLYDNVPELTTGASSLLLLLLVPKMGK